MWWNKKKSEENTQVFCQCNQLTELQEKYDNLKKDFNDYVSNDLKDQREREEKEKLMNDVEVAVDFKKLNAFSIERQHYDADLGWVTLIGFWVSSGDKTETNEWILHITPERHNALCADFKKCMGL